MSERIFPQEHDAIRSRLVIVVGLVGLVVVTVSLLAVRALIRAFPTPAPPRPPLELSREVGDGTPIDLDSIEHDAHGPALRAAQRARLESWGWVDRDAGIARIPIDEAIEIVVEPR